jgi:cytochrome P450
MAGREASLPEIDSYDSAHALMRRLRDSDPVHWSPDLSAWLLVRYGDVASAFMNENLASTGMTRRIDLLPTETRRSLEPLRACVDAWMGLSAAGSHRRMARLIRPLFAPRIMGRLEAYIQESADALLGQIARRGGGDLVTDFSYPFSAGVIARALGLPAADAGALVEWTEAISAVFHLSDSASLLGAQHAVEVATDYLREVVAARRRQPRDDLVSRFVDGLRTGLIVDEHELIANLIMMLSVGFETTATVIDTGTFLLLSRPEQWHRIRNDRSLIPRMIEEIVRYDGPVFFTTRVATRNMVLGTKQVTAGEMVLLGTAAANRDPAVFEDPDEFLIDRTNNRHLGFGLGPYSCVGAYLARMEARIAFAQMLEHLPNLSLSRQPEWREFPPMARWVSHLWVTP